MGSDKKKEKTGGYKIGSALIWAGGQWAVCWFLMPDLHLWKVVSACFSAFVAGWTTSVLLSRFAKWGANAGVMMVLGVIVGLMVFSGAFSGISALFDWWNTKEVKVDWERLQTFLLSWAALPPAGLGLLTGLYVKSKFPSGKK